MKYAILAGIEEYESGSGISNLRFACRDVYSIARALRERCGFDEVRVLADRDDAEFGVQRVGNPTDSAILKALVHAATKLKEEDLFFFLFAGHGVGIPFGETIRSYLLAQNAHLDLGTGRIEVGDLRVRLSNLACRSRAIFLDCCRNGVERGLGDGDNPMGESLARDLLAASRREGHDGTTVLMTACRPGHRAWEWDEERHGVFSYFVRKGLEGAAWSGDQLVAQDLCAYVEKELKNWSDKTGRRQASDFQQLESAEKIFLVEGAASRPAPYRPAKVKCPSCERHNEEGDTFECRICRLDHLSKEHFEKDRHCCEKCASQTEGKKETVDVQSLPQELPRPINACRDLLEKKGLPQLISKEIAYEHQYRIAKQYGIQTTSIFSDSAFILIPPGTIDGTENEKPFFLSVDPYPRPAEGIRNGNELSSINEARAICHHLSKTTRTHFSLPTENQLNFAIAFITLLQQRAPVQSNQQLLCKLTNEDLALCKLINCKLTCKTVEFSDELPCAQFYPVTDFQVRRI